MKFSLNFFKKAARIIKPKMEIGGLEISDGNIVFLSIDPETKKINKISVPLEQGIIAEGVLKDYGKFSESLKTLHSRITSKRVKKIPVVVSISDANVYTQNFILPVLQSSSLEEAVRLNLQVISPIDFSRAYSDWQQVATTQHVDHQIDILASFAEKSIVDSFCKVLTESDFVPVAVEQKLSSLTRVVTSIVGGYNPQKSYFLLYVSSDGVGFSIIKSGHLYFDRFALWSSLIKENDRSRQITLKEFGDVIARESHQVVNYYSSHFRDSVNSLYIVAPGLEDQVKGIITGQFSLDVEPLTLKEYSLDSSWLVALGAALRGLVSRSSDTEISLAPEGTEDKFVHSQIIEFISLWRSISLVTFVTILAACIGSYFFLNSLMTSTLNDFNSSAGSYSGTYLSTLTEKAGSFNRYIDQALLARSQQTRWARLVSDVVALQGTAISIDRFYIQSPALPIIINGRANTSNDAINFKNHLAALPYVSNVDLPISSLVPNGNQVVFSLSFNVNAANLR